MKPTNSMRSPPFFFPPRAATHDAEWHDHTHCPFKSEAWNDLSFSDAWTGRGQCPSLRDWFVPLSSTLYRAKTSKRLTDCLMRRKSGRLSDMGPSFPKDLSHYESPTGNEKGTGMDRSY